MAQKTKTNFKVTFGYRAVISVDVKAETLEAAETQAIKEFNNKFRLSGGNNINIEDDNYKIAGTINTTETWDMLYKD